MMTQLNLPMPPTLMGAEAQQIVQLHRYLFRISEQLNQAMTAQSVTIEDSLTQQHSTVSTETLDAELTGQYNRVKSLIVKTADIVRSEMEQIEATLRSQYIAKSEWGTYKEDIQGDIIATAEGVVQKYDYQSQIDELGSGVADFREYKIQTSSHIQSGIIGYDDDGFPIVGIAIGDDLKYKEIDGEVYIDMTRNLATYTADSTTFWQNGVVAARITNSELIITNVSIAGKLTLGGKWEFSHTNGFSIKWIGG